MTDPRELVRQAEQKLKGGFLSFLTGGPNFEDAQDIYQQAANQYKLSKEWNEAAKCFEQCAYCAKKTGDSNGEANFLQEAGNVYKKSSTTMAVEQYEKAIAILSASGRFQQSGKLLMSIGELYEAERFSHKEAKDFYVRASDMFELDDHGKSNHTKCQLKVAEFAAKDGELQEAIRIFETQGEKALQNTLLQYGAKDHFLRAGILHLVEGDSVTTNLAVQKYCALDPRFASSREGDLIKDLAAAFEDRDVDKFTNVLFDYDKTTPLDSWKTEFLVKVKESMSGDGGGALDAGAIDLT